MAEKQFEYRGPLNSTGQELEKKAYGMFDTFYKEVGSEIMGSQGKDGAEDDDVRRCLEEALNWACKAMRRRPDVKG